VSIPSYVPFECTPELTSSSAIELLLESGKFQPTRTVILAFGMDEETGGKVVRLIAKTVWERVCLD
jgi:acetylornithine deacetylase/succinyl-diaminopimelate desuccinylase-like protein